MTQVSTNFTAVTDFLRLYQEGDFDAAAGVLEEDVTIVPSPHWVSPGTFYRGRDGWHSLVEHLGLRSNPIVLDLQLRPVGRHVLAAGFGWREHPGDKRDVHAVAWVFTPGAHGIRRVEGFRDGAEALAALERLPDEEGEEGGVAFDAAPVPMILLDDAGLIVRANDALIELLGVPETELRGRALNELAAPPADGDSSGWLGPEAYVGERALLAADGSPRRVEVRVRKDRKSGRYVLVLFERNGAAGSKLLTKREREILRLLLLGLNGPEIAGRLGISVNTVRTHVANAMTALQAKTRAQAVAEAVARGELEP